MDGWGRSMAITSWKDDARAATNPLFNENALKLGVFGLNSGHQIMSTAPDRYVADWVRADATAGLVDHFGLEALVSLMGWIDHPEHEPFTWASALGARHSRPAVVATMHMQLMHPTFVAKAAATIDLVTNGRFAMNMVAGANPATFAAFGEALQDHQTRYAHAAEFMELLFKLWTEERPFAFSGHFFDIPKVVSKPRPIQQFPAIFNAGMSGRGRQFACKYADIIFTLIDDDDGVARAQIAEYKRIAREDHGRDVQVWAQGYPVIRDTRAEADAFLHYYTVEHANTAQIDAWVKAMGAGAQEDMDPAYFARMHSRWAAGNGTALVGTPDEVAEELRRLSQLGLDGVLLNTMEPEAAVTAVGEQLLPRLEALGLRKPAEARSPRRQADNRSSERGSAALANALAR